MKSIHNKMKAAAAAVGVALLLGACVTAPVGPSIAAMPGSGKSFDQFRADDADCRGYAQQQSGGATAQDAATDSTIRSAALGTAIGALAGAAIGGHSGAGAGAAGGLVVGTAAGAGAGTASGVGVQHRYDNAYTQCMYAKGERVPVYGNMEQRHEAPPPPTSYAPPPPPGSPPPPPPGYH
jgi:hypothetical protein